MNNFRIVVILAVMAVAAAAQAPPPQDSNASQVAAPALQSTLTILKPKSGEKLRQNTVTVAYALSNPGASAAGSPNFQLRLDSQDPVSTTTTEYTFTGLQPGAHKVTVQLVDANGTPVVGALAEIQFTVLQQASRNYGPQAIAAALRLEPADIRVEQTKPSASGALPLLSVIGFGALLGGIASALKTRGRV